MSDHSIYRRISHSDRGLGMAHRPTIYVALMQKLGRIPTNAELKADVQRIIAEGTAERKRLIKSLRKGK